MDWYLQEMIDDILGYARRTALPGIEIIQDDDDDIDDVRFDAEGNLMQGLAATVLSAFDGLATGDALRVWWRQRDDRVLVVIENTRETTPVGTLLDRALAQLRNHLPGAATMPSWVSAAGGVMWNETITDDAGAAQGDRWVIGLPAGDWRPMPGE